jgi:hypothetical protein
MGKHEILLRIHIHQDKTFLHGRTAFSFAEVVIGSNDWLERVAQ